MVGHAIPGKYIPHSSRLGRFRNAPCSTIGLLLLAFSNCLRLPHAQVFITAYGLASFNSNDHTVQCIKLMGTVSYLCGLLCFIAMLGHRRPNRHLLNNNQQNTKEAQQLLQIAKSQIGVREATGRNDGVQIEKYLAYTGNTKGEAWCAAFVSWVFGQASFAQPRTAWSPALFPLAKQITVAEPAAVFGIYFPEKGRIAHVGLVERVRGNWVYSIEGNTNVLGSREGDGVYRKLRHAKTIKAYANWLPEQKGAAR